MREWLSEKWHGWGAETAIELESAFFFSFVENHSDVHVTCPIITRKSVALRASINPLDISAFAELLLVIVIEHKSEFQLIFQK